jgi:hypothetical protein
MATLTLGTAKIARSKSGQITLTWMNHGSFLVGEQTFGDHSNGWNAALRFCRERGLRVIEA